MALLHTRQILPAYRASLVITLGWIGSMVVLPFVLLFITAMELEWRELWQVMTNERVLHSIWLSLKLSALAALFNLCFGTLTAWVLTRYQFWGKQFLNTLIDLPFALPTAVAGIVLATLYAPNGLFGQYFTHWDLQIAFTPLGILVALIFVSFPFTVRAVQPVLAELDHSIEEAATTLGANRLTIIRRVILPTLYPAMISGAGMGFARSLGEYGSVIFIAGNVPLVSEIAPLIIMSKLDIYDVQGASAVALFMLMISFMLLFSMNAFEKYVSRYMNKR